MPLLLSVMSSAKPPVRASSEPLQVEQFWLCIRQSTIGISTSTVEEFGLMLFLSNWANEQSFEQSNNSMEQISFP